MTDMIERLLFADAVAFVSALALMGLIVWYVAERWTFVPRRRQRERFTERMGGRRYE